MTTIHAKMEAAGAVSVTAGAVAWVPLVNEIVQFAAGIIGIISGLVFLYNWYKDRKKK
jgi:peptidoglycan biosynthesis protein MviN/MurJ (putative lipid II flippase)